VYLKVSVPRFRESWFCDMTAYFRGATGSDEPWPAAYLHAQLCTKGLKVFRLLKPELLKSNVGWRSHDWHEGPVMT
jgi:hypothetical protein